MWSQLCGSIVNFLISSMKNRACMVALFASKSSNLVFSSPVWLADCMHACLSVCLSVWLPLCLSVWLESYFLSNKDHVLCVRSNLVGMTDYHVQYYVLIHFHELSDSDILVFLCLHVCIHLDIWFDWEWAIHTVWLHWDWGNRGRHSESMGQWWACGPLQGEAPYITSPAL